MTPKAELTIKSGNTQVLGGVTMIDTPRVASVLDYARVHSEPCLFHLGATLVVGRSDRAREELGGEVRRRSP